MSTGRGRQCCHTSYFTRWILVMINCIKPLLLLLLMCGSSITDSVLRVSDSLDLEIWLAGTFPFKFSIWNSEITTSEFKWNAATVWIMSKSARVLIEQALVVPPALCCTGSTPCLNQVAHFLSRVTCERTARDHFRSVRSKENDLCE